MMLTYSDRQLGEKERTMARKLGRPRIAEDKRRKTVSITIRPEVWDEHNRRANQRNLSASRLTEIMLARGMKLGKR